jgi:integrase
MGRLSLGAFLTKEDAERAERDALSAKDRGVELSPRKVTVAEILERFIADRRSKQRALRTIDRYEGLVELSIVPHVGTLPLAKLTPAHVSGWLATLQEKGGARIAKMDRKPVLRDGKRVVEFTNKPLSAKTTKHAYALLRSALRWAVRHDLAARNVAEAVDPPTVGRSQARALAEGEVTRLFAAADETRWGPFFRVALGTAARRGELLALRWSDVDFEDGTMTIARAVVETSGPKRGARVSDMSARLVLR